MREFFLLRAPDVRRVILCTLVIGVPVAFLRITYDPFNVPKLTLLMIGVPLVAALRIGEIWHGRSAANLRRVAIPGAALLIPLVAAWALSPYRDFALFGYYPRFQGLVPYVLVVAFGVLVADAFAEDAGMLARAFIWSGGVVGIYTLIQVIGLDPFQWNVFGTTNVVTSTIGNSNFVGGYLGVVLPVAVGYGIADRDHRRRTIYLGLAIVGGWLAARSQGGWLAGIGGLSVVAGFYLARRWKLAGYAGIGVAGLIAAAAAGIVVVSLAFPDSRVASATAFTRGRWWVAAARMMFDSPIFGRGPNTFAIEGVRHRMLDDALDFGFDFPDDPHSVLLSFLSNAGLLGGIGFLTVFVWSTWKTLKIETGDLLRAGFAGSTFAYLIQSLVSIDELALRVGVWIGLAGLAATGGQLPAFGAVRKSGSKSTSKRKHAPAGRSRSNKGPKARIPEVVRRGSPRASAAIMIAGLVALAVIVYASGFLVTDIRVRAASSLFGRGETARAAQQMDQAISFRDDVSYRGLYARNLRDLALEVGGDGEQLFERSDVLFTGFLDDVPFVFGIASHARLLDQWGEDSDQDHDDEAVARYKEAIALDPLNPLIRVEAAEVLVELDRAEDALVVLEPAADQVGTDQLPQFWGILALVKARSGDDIGAATAIETALALDPAQPSALEAQKILDRADR